MAKNKKKTESKKSKKEKAFIVSSMKKAKTKPIATSLKKMSFRSKTNAEKADESFQSLRKELAEAASSSTKTAAGPNKGKSPTPKSKKANKPEATVDMDMATESFAKL